MQTVFRFLRNTAVDTVEQQLLFVGTETGKLLAMRDIIKKVGRRTTFSIVSDQVSITDFCFARLCTLGLPASDAGLCPVHRSSSGALPRAGVRRHQRGRDPRRPDAAAGWCDARWRVVSRHRRPGLSPLVGLFFTWSLQRDNVVSSFRSGKIWVLICTALLARGIDFKGVNIVLNYDFPTSAVEYIHRIG